jgi:hypothetical protein
MRHANDAIRFLLELALLAAVSHAACAVGSEVWLQIVLALAVLGIVNALLVRVVGAATADRAESRTRSYLALPKSIRTSS